MLETTGRTRAAESVRLFMMPGMTHCAGGEGPNAFDKVAVMEQWVEHGQAPARIVASHSTDGKIDRTRPLVVNGKVFVTTVGRLTVYGLLP